MNKHLRRRAGPAFEHHREDVIPRYLYFRRQFRFFGYASGIIGFSLLLGTVGYCACGGMSVVDGFYNASMILTGMGPIDQMQGTGAKIFASLYALYSGIAFLTTSAVLLAPAIHRLLHILHVGERDI
jgi:hypothetical protein